MYVNYFSLMESQVPHTTFFRVCNAHILQRYPYVSQHIAPMYSQREHNWNDVLCCRMRRAARLVAVWALGCLDGFLDCG